MRAFVVSTLALMLGAGCAHQIKVLTEPPGAVVSVGGKDQGPAPVTIEEDLLSDLPLVVEARKPGYAPARAVIERSELNLVPLIGGLCGCATCYSLGCVSGAGLANFAPLCGAGTGFCLLLGVSGACNTAPIVSALAAPSLLTVPLMSAGALLGTTPLGLLLLAKRGPDEVKLTLSAQAGAREEGAASQPVEPAAPSASPESQPAAPPAAGDTSGGAGPDDSFDY